MIARAIRDIWSPVMFLSSLHEPHTSRNALAFIRFSLLINCSAEIEVVYHLQKNPEISVGM